MTRPPRGRLAGLTGAVALALALAPPSGPARSEDAPCVLDKCLGLKPPPGPPAPALLPDPGTPEGASVPGESTAEPVARGRGATASGRFDFYVLALSWSPGFCATGGADKAPGQCAPGSNLGFVVHGLWPQYAHGFPSDCAPGARVPSRQALDTVRGLYPDEGLARYEWRKHGTCTGQSPTDYFADVRRAREAIVVPQPFQAPRESQTWVPIDVARAFAAANGGLRPDEMAVTCRGDTIEEVRICFGKDLRGFVPCPEVSRASCRTRQIAVPAPR